MKGKLIDGQKIAKDIRQTLKSAIAALSSRKPGLAFILVGEDPASQAYVRMKIKGCKEVGIHSQVIPLPENVSQEQLIKTIQELNATSTIDGILVQQPLPSHISIAKVTETTDPKKDVDGFHPMNMGKLLLGETSGFVPCTPLGIVTLLEKYEITVSGKHVVILGRSNIVGKPLAALFGEKVVLGKMTLNKFNDELFRLFVPFGNDIMSPVFCFELHERSKAPF